MARGGVTILGAWLAHHQLGFEDFRERLEKAGAQAGAPMGLSERTFYRWLNGQVERPNHAQAAALEEVTGFPAALLLAPVPDPDGGPEQEAADYPIEVHREGLLAAHNRRVARGYVGLEWRATSIYSWDHAVIPGLLQTRAYALAILETDRPPRPPVERRRLADARIERQAILERSDPPQLWAVVGEAALRKIVGGRTTMAGQLDRLVELYEVPHVQVQVLPTASDAHPSMASGLRLIHLPGRDPPMAFSETSIDDGMYLGTGPDVDAYALKFHEIARLALGRAESLARIQEIAAATREGAPTG